MSEERKLTIARALTRIKTINAELGNIVIKVRAYGAWNDKVKHPLGDPKKEVKPNLEEARKEIASEYQKFNDLTSELVKLRTAIDKANQVTPITIGEVTMTIADALAFRRLVQPHVQSLVNAYNSSIAQANINVQKYNTPIMGNANFSDDDKKNLAADVAYLVKKEEVQKQSDFVSVFMIEIDGTLNEVNALTEITVE